MKKKYLILFALVVVTLTLLLSGCGSGQDELEGKYVATFELNGGKLDIGSTEVKSKINYAYEPDSYIIDPSTYGNYKISRPGYVFIGWYKTAECNESDKWDFKTEKITGEALTLYAGWEKEIIYTFSMYYIDGTEEKSLGSYTVSAGAAFEDYRNYAASRTGFTPFGYYSDAQMQTPWNFEYKHPGGDVDTDIKVYVDYIEGDWIIVDNYTELVNAASKGNIYLAADIDCEGKSLYFRNAFKYTFEGNGHTVSNFTVEKQGTARVPTSAIFKELGEGAKIQNVSFTNVTFSYTDVNKDTIKGREVAALAISAGKCTVTNVTVSGKIVTDYEGEIAKLNEAIYDDAPEATISEFTANIVIEKQS